MEKVREVGCVCVCVHGVGEVWWWAVAQYTTACSRDCRPTLADTVNRIDGDDHDTLLSTRTYDCARCKACEGRKEDSANVPVARLGDASMTSVSRLGRGAQSISIGS